MASGIYDGFEGFRNPSQEERESAVKNWLVVLDTNVLLSLYSFQGPTLDAFVDVFAALGERLFVPNQVVDEFWRNRRTVLKQNQGRHRERDEIEDAFSSIENTLQAWHRRVVDRTAPLPAHVQRALNAANDEVMRLIDARTDEAAVTTAETPTYDDRVLARISDLLKGRVGPAPDPGQLDKLRRQGRERVEKRIPPGYMDSGKNPERAVGDFMVWSQVIEEAKSRRSGVLLITNDQKEDWWASGGGVRLARPELVAELRQETQQELIMMRAHELVAMGELLGVTVSEATVSDAEQTLAESAESDTVLSPLAQAYNEFWKRFEVAAHARKWTRGKAPSANWWSMSAGGGGNSYSVSYSKFGCRSELYLGHPDRLVNLHRLRLLASRRDEIQRLFGTSAEIHFEELPENVACRLDIRLEDGRSIGDRALWDDTLDWFISTQENLRGAIEATGGIPRSTPDQV